MVFSMYICFLFVLGLVDIVVTGNCRQMRTAQLFQERAVYFNVSRAPVLEPRVEDSHLVGLESVSEFGWKD